MTKVQLLVAAIAGALLAVPVWDGAVAQEKAAKAQKKRSGGLAGSEGDVKRKVLITSDTEGGCAAVYRRYVAAGGHSAYAATPTDYFYGGEFVCGVAYSVGSQAEAERRALAQCKSTVAHYKAKNKSIKISGACEVYASK